MLTTILDNHRRMIMLALDSSLSPTHKSLLKPEPTSPSIYNWNYMSIEHVCHWGVSGEWLKGKLNELITKMLSLDAGLSFLLTMRRIESYFPMKVPCVVRWCISCHCLVQDQFSKKAKGDTQAVSEFWVYKFGNTQLEVIVPIHQKWKNTKNVNLKK